MQGGTGENRAFSLDRSVFDLVDTNGYLSLTDPKLLGWYLRLSPADRKIIQDEGGFQQFLERHPALELSRHHVYVKYNSGSAINSTSPVQPIVMSNRHTFKRPDRKTCRCEMSHLDMEMSPNNVRETLTLLTCSNSGTGSQKHPHEEMYRMEGGSSDATLYADRMALASFPVDVELERCRLRKHPELRSHTAVTENQSVDFTYADVTRPQSEWLTEREFPSVETVNDDVSSTFEDQSYRFYSIMVDDKSILACRPSEDVKADDNGAQSGPVSSSGEALAASRDSVININTRETYTSPLPSVTTCDMMVGTEPALCVSAFTQTEDPVTADKHINTEVRMADLDYVAEEFIRLAMANKELREQKKKRKRPKNPPANIQSALQKPVCDSNQMGEKILAGVPLKQLKPLSVDSAKICTEASYIPAQISGDALGDVPPCSQELCNPSGEDNGCPDDESRHGCQQNQRQEQKENSKARRAVTSVPQEGDAVYNANKQEDKTPTAVHKEFSTSETWYDAKEDLESAQGAVAPEKGLHREVITEDVTNAEAASKEDKSSVLFVSNIPSHVTENDVMLMFERYHASKVSISPPKNDPRVAMVTVSGVQSAEAAVRELNGRSMRGCTLHVEHINRANGGSYSQVSDTQQKDQTTAASSSTEVGYVVHISPTGKRTWVFQNYPTMGAIDALMAELTQNHPGIRKQRFAEALEELNTKYGGVLCSLPLRTIREMASELLTSSASATQL